ncbi:hypothetical protein [Streptodolium elevatio]|uniref:ATP/GTP-binding protein n=1 Tax=Streptodolium elevatio TaxID=3157996 RepID=A0ABV3DR06_9ACTN
MRQWLGSMPPPDPDFDDTAGDSRPPPDRFARPAPASGPAPGSAPGPTGGPAPAPPPGVSVPLSRAAAPAYAPPAQPAPATAAAPGGTPGAPGAPGNDVRVALWGASGSGKSTYLWALPRALHGKAGRSDGWTITPLDDTSRTYLADAETALVVDRVLPQGTLSSLSVRWLLARSSRSPFDRLRPAPASRILLTVEDRPGGDYKDALDAAVAQLADADAIIYLYDPVSDSRERSETFQAFSSTLRAVSNRMLRNGQLREDGRLPQHLAVCVTKFDDPAIFDRACRGNWATQSDTKPYLPRIADRYAHDFFAELCKSTGGTGEEVRRLIQDSFMKERVRYYVTSSIGFNLDHEDEFDPDDYGNLDHEPAPQRGPRRPGADTSPQYRERLRSIPVPVNVLEPLVDLDRLVRRDRRGGLLRSRSGGTAGRRP